LAAAAANIRRNTLYKRTKHVTTKHSPLNMHANAKTYYPYTAIQPMK